MNVINYFSLDIFQRLQRWRTSEDVNNSSISGSRPWRKAAEKVSPNIWPVVSAWHTKMVAQTLHDTSTATRQPRTLSPDYQRRGLATNFETQRIQILDDRNVAHQIELPTSALRLLVDILAELAVGNAVRVVPVHAELTTQEAADLLNVSRPHFIKLLETQALPYHRTGKHRRIRFDDLMKFKVKRDQASERAMSELAKQAQELKLGYE
jgi:excisionase family DNA binding protein